MTFESMIENNNAESFNLKVTFGSEIRRATFSGNSFGSLSEIVAKLFSLDQGSILLKYQDDDDDKITMSSDSELQDALKLVKEKKLLRVFVELKAQAPPAPAPEADQTPLHHQPFGYGGRCPPFMHQGRGGFSRGPHRGGFGHGPHPFPTPHSFPGGQGPQSFPGPFPGSFHGPFRGGHRGGHHHDHGFGSHGPFGSFTPASPNPTTAEQQEGSASSPLFAHGSFSPAGPYAAGPYAARCAFKEHKKAMKEQIKLMKENAVTEDDKLAIKEFKRQMMAECMRAKCHEKKWEKKHDKHEKKCERKHDKHEKKCEKNEKKWEKKWEKKKENGRLLAKHVADLTVPDNSELPADTPVTKTWKLRNVGITNWPADAQLIFISKKGDNLNGPERVLVGTVEPNQEVDVSVTFITPSEPGRYIGYYRMADGEGAKFGQRVWVSFFVPVPPAVNATTVTAATAQLDLNKDSDLAMD